MNVLYEKVPESILFLIMLCGIMAISMAVAFGIIAVKEEISGTIRERKRIYEIKHRFDRPPTAKCYCIDCKRHSKDGTCHKFNGWKTADAWFCWDAEPNER